MITYSVWVRVIAVKQTVRNSLRFFDNYIVVTLHGLAFGLLLTVLGGGPFSLIGAALVAIGCYMSGYRDGRRHALDRLILRFEQSGRPPPLDIVRVAESIVQQATLKHDP